MTQKQENPGLLGTLQRLYSKLSLAVLRDRMDTYHRDGTSGIGVGQDISSSLAGHIDKLATSEEAKCKGVACEDVAQIVPNATTDTAPQTENHSQQQTQPENQSTLVSSVLDGLAKYFKSGHSEPSLQPHLSEKLKKSTLDHIHTALRLARQGDATTAKLHADIATSALKEVAHYTPEEEYKVFAAEVDALLSEIKGHKE